MLLVFQVDWRTSLFSLSRAFLALQQRMMVVVATVDQPKMMLGGPMVRSVEDAVTEAAPFSDFETRIVVRSVV